MMTWGDGFPSKPFVPSEELRAMNERVLQHFKDTVARIEAEEDAATIRQLLGDVCVEVERG